MHPVCKFSFFSFGALNVNRSFALIFLHMFILGGGGGVVPSV